jgi:hypothetical protein
LTTLPKTQIVRYEKIEFDWFCRGDGEERHVKGGREELGLEDLSEFQLDP